MDLGLKENDTILVHRKYYKPTLHYVKSITPNGFIRAVGETFYPDGRIKSKYPIDDTMYITKATDDDIRQCRERSFINKVAMKLRSYSFEKELTYEQAKAIQEIIETKENE